MKNNLFLLLFMLVTHLAVGQVEQITWFRSTLPVQESYKLFTNEKTTINDSIYFTKQLLFNDGKNEVRFKNDSVYTTFNYSECYTTYCNPKTIDIMEKVLDNAFRYTNDRYSESLLKLQFYEKYFGKLEINKECATFTPVANPPKMEECKIEKTTHEKRSKTLYSPH